MRILGTLIGVTLATTLIASVMQASTPAPKDGFTLAGAIPNDVFLYVAQRHNDERQFLDGYWSEVLDALKQSGLRDDLMGLVGSLLGSDGKQAVEFEQLRERASRLLAGVDWEQLDAKEFVFAERFVPPTQISSEEPPIMMPNMVWLLRGNSEGTAKNYEGLVAILEGIADEVNKALGRQALVVEKTARTGAKVASMNMLAMIPGAHAEPLSVALLDDVVIIGMRAQLFGDVLGLMQGGDPKQALANSPRFKAAFAQLPPAEDGMTYFDMHGLVKPLRAFFETLVATVGGPADVYVRAKMTAEVGDLNKRALSAYQRGDAKEALALTKQAYAADGENSILLYNLACFSALVGEKGEALNWLEKAVDGGFYAPRKISTDSDLESLLGEPRYKAALAKAEKLALEYAAEDTVLNSANTGEVFRLRMQAQQAYEQKNYEQALKFTEQAYAIAPKDSQVLYLLGCLHTLLGHVDQGLSYLEQAVDGGFCCPRHISKDPDWESVRNHERYIGALTNARKRAAEVQTRREREWAVGTKQVMGRLADAASVFDYSAAVETTDGYAAWTESITALVPGAKDAPIYPLFAKAGKLTNFDEYLPEETASFSISGGLDLRELYKFILDSIRLLGPRGEELLARWSDIQGKLGIDVQKDIIEWTDGELVTISLADGAGWVGLVKVNNEQMARGKIAAAIDSISTKLPETLAQVAAKNPAVAGLAMLNVRSSPVDHERLKGFQNLHLVMSARPVAVWGVADGYLILGSSADAVALCLATAKGEHPNIRKNARVMGEAIVPTGPFASVSLTDQRHVGEELAAGIGFASMGAGMMASMVPEPNLRPVLAKIAGILTKLGPVVRKIDFYKSAASHTTFDGKMWRARSVIHYVSPAEHAAERAE